MANNLRIVYNNHINLPTTLLTASAVSSANATTANLKGDVKSLVFRSSTAGIQINTKSIIIVDLAQVRDFNCVILPFTNLTATATVLVRGHASLPTTSSASPPVLSGGGATTTLFNGLVCPWALNGLPDWNPLINTAAGYSYGKGNHAAAWLPSTGSFRYLSIEVTDTSQSTRIIEISKLVVGMYWEPTYNTNFGVSHSMEDMSEHERSESGNLLTNRGPRYRTLQFDLSYLDASDKQEFTRFMIANGTFMPLFISVFPNNGNTSALLEQERSHMLYGKLVSTPSLKYFAPQVYSTSLEVEEI